MFVKDAAASFIKETRESRSRATCLRELGVVQGFVERSYEWKGLRYVSEVFYIHHKVFMRVSRLSVFTNPYKSETSEFNFRVWRTVNSFQMK